MVGGNMPTLTRLWLTVRVGYNVETKSMDIDGSLENMLNVFSVLYVTRTLSNGTINGAINAPLQYNCMKRSLFTSPAVTCRTFLLWT